MKTIQKTAPLSGVLAERMEFNTAEIALQFWQDEVRKHRKESREPGLLKFLHNGELGKVTARELVFLDQEILVDGKPLLEERVLIRTGSASKETVAGKLIKKYSVITGDQNLTYFGILLSPKEILSIFFENV